MTNTASPAPRTPGRTSTDAPDVAAIAQQRLRECPYPPLRRVMCRYRQGVLVMTGKVPTFYMKQMAQTLMRGLDGVEKIDNRLVVS